MSTDLTEPSGPPSEEPVDHHEVAVIAIGMALWALALVVLAVFFRHDLKRHHAGWWLWACGLGLAFGLYGLRVTMRRRARGLRS
jgi:membrane protein DedA with SNARE-associated domain